GAATRPAIAHLPIGGEKISFVGYFELYRERRDGATPCATTLVPLWRILGSALAPFNGQRGSSQSSIRPFALDIRCARVRSCSAGARSQPRRRSSPTRAM